MDYEIGQVVILHLVGSVEVVGEWVGRFTDYVRLRNACHVIDTAPGPEDVAPGKLLLAVVEDGSFSDEIAVREDKILYIRMIKKPSALYQLYHQTVTEIVTTPAVG